ncbi:carbonic anhydrase 4b isoform X2 [Perca flavescens]|uniref:carbonic anhydrase 4b isoform X2 n=1 Tax=Perca flavescens TaxID=8167 RepID=UPI00106EDA4B|nr:carbonic anhydrase 4-like isoform X2 [Perca flavescens]
MFKSKQEDSEGYSTFRMLLVPVLFWFASLTKVVSGADWCYQSQVTCNHTCTGPEEWGVVSQNCSGRSQSPVNIVTRRVLPDERLTPFHFTGYQEAFHGHLINNGHTVQLDLPSSIRIEGGNLVTPYKAVQLHLHWGKDGGPGSEHTVDGERFPMEESKSANKKFDPLINALKNITQPTNSTTLMGVSLEMLIPPPKNMTKYFRYDGSLTTPGCDEATVWSLFENTVPLSRNQLAAFSQLQFSNGKQMVETYRPVQPLNARQVYYSRGHGALVSTVLLIMSVLVSSALSLSPSV